MRNERKILLYSTSKNVFAMYLMAVKVPMCIDKGLAQKAMTLVASRHLRIERDEHNDSSLNMPASFPLFCLQEEIK